MQALRLKLRPRPAVRLTLALYGICGWRGFGCHKLCWCDPAQGQGWLAAPQRNAGSSGDRNQNSQVRLVSLGITIRPRAGTAGAGVVAPRHGAFQLTWACPVVSPHVRLASHHQRQALRCLIRGGHIWRLRWTHYRRGFDSTTPRSSDRSYKTALA